MQNPAIQERLQTLAIPDHWKGTAAETSSRKWRHAYFFLLQKIYCIIAGTASREGKSLKNQIVPI